MPDAGWYRDPQDPTSEEYWDGQNWSGQRRPSTGPQESYDDQQTSVQPSYDDQQTSVQSGYSGYTTPAPAPTPPQRAPQSGYAPPAYGQPGYQQPAYGAPGYAQAPFGQPGAGVPATTSRSRRKLPLIIGGVLVVVVAAGLVVFFLRSGSSSPSITYDGKPIAAADTVLTKAGKAVGALVAKQHGAKSGDTRCYYVQPVKPARDAKASDVQDSLRCGPVLFVDGNTADEYLTVPLTASTSGSPVHLSADTSSLAGATPGAVPSSVKLVRPDGQTPPSGNGGLKVPLPPPAAKDSLVTAKLGGDTPKSLTNASMVTKNQEVTLLAAGTVSTYGSGASARSAPSGQELIAFQIEGGDGAVSSGGFAQPKLVVDGEVKSIPPASGDTWDVASVPSGSSPVISLNANGYTQTLSLPDGTPGASNIAVLTRTHTTGLIGKEFGIPCTYSKGSNSLNARLSISAPNANLYFWIPTHPNAHPDSPGSAYLSINLTYLDSSQPGDTFGFEPALLHLKLPDGTNLIPTNVADKDHIYDVFTVPADYTTGKLTIGGSTLLDDGVTQTLKKSKSFQVHIRQG